MSWKLVPFKYVLYAVSVHQTEVLIWASFRLRLTTDALVLCYLVLYKGNTHRLSATVCPTNATTKTVRWHSSRPSVASVNTYTGTVTAKAAGSAIIYATAQDGSGVRSCCTVSVRQTVVCSVEETPVNKVQGSTFADPVDVYTGAHMMKCRTIA